MLLQSGRWVCVAALAMALAACGGGGGSKLTPVPLPPPPPPAPPPPPSAEVPVKIFNDPEPGEFASVGVSIDGPGGTLDTYENPDERFGPISTSDQDQAHIRYTESGHYEVLLPGYDWDQLTHYKGIVDPTSDNNYFQPQGVEQNYAHLLTSLSRNHGYSYSELAHWASSEGSRWGFVAFGVPTPAGAVPVAGSASFEGKVWGSTDILFPHELYGGYYPLNADGTVQLNFDFAAGTLEGAMTLFLPDGMQPLELGTFAFAETVFSAGSTTYSGVFDTAETGQNFFLGQFTGPGAEETIGAWALPFLFDKSGDYLTADGQVHQAFGAWIARRPQ